MEKREQLIGFGVADAVEDCLRLFSRSNEMLFSQLREVLGQSRLAQTHPLHQFAYREFTPLGQMTENKQTAFVRQGLQERHCLARLPGKFRG